MILGLGLDVVDITDLERRLAQPGFVRKVFTAGEIDLCEQYATPAEHYAGKFAAKEAFMKAIGAGIRQKVWFTQIEVLNEASGQPVIHAYGVAAQRVAALGAGVIHVSVSHTAGIAVAVVVLAVATE